MSIFSKRHTSPEPPARRRPQPGGTGARRNEAFSYHAQRSGSAANTGRLDAAAIEALHPEAPTWLQRRKWLLLAATGAGLVLLVALTNLSGKPQVTTVTSSSNQYFLQDPAVYKQAVEKALHSSLLNQNKVTFDSAKLTHDVQQSCPEIKSVQVKMPLIGNQPHVVLTPYRASYILATANTTYLLDETGRAVISTSQIPDAGSLSVPVLQDKNNHANVTPGSQAVSGATVHFADVVTNVLASQKVPFTALVMPAGSSELDVYITSKPYFVKFNLQGDARLQAGTFIATKLKLEKDHITPAQYVDVRVPERAYYK